MQLSKNKLNKIRVLSKQRKGHTSNYAIIHENALRKFFSGSSTFQQNKKAKKQAKWKKKLPSELKCFS